MWIRNLLLFIGMVLLVSSVTATAVNLTGLVTYYQFNDTVGSDSMGINRGDMLNGATNAAGYIGNGMTLDGVNDYFNISNVAFFKNDTQNRFMINMWIKPSVVGTSANDRIFLAKNTSGSTIFELNVGTSLNESQHTIIGHTQRLKQGVIAQGAWEMITMFRNGSDLKFYKNGALVNWTQTAVTPFQNINNLTIGRFDTNGINAVIDEFSYWTEVKTPTDIYGIYQNYTSGYDIFNSTNADAPHVGNTYWIAVNGSNSNDGLSIDTPWRIDKLSTIAFNGDNVSIVTGTYNVNTSVSLDFHSNTQNVKISGYGGVVNLTQCADAWTVTPNSLWTNVTTYTGHANTWKTSFTGLIIDYPLVYFMNNTEMLIHRCWSKTSSGRGGTSCAYSVYFGEYPEFSAGFPAFYQVFANQSNNDIFVMFPGGQNPNNLPICIADERATFGVNNNDGTGNVTISGLSFTLHRRALELTNSSKVIIENNYLDEGYATIQIEGQHQRGDTIIRYNNITGHNPDGMYQDFVKHMFEESDIVKTGSDIIGPVLVYNNILTHTLGGFSLVTDAYNEACGSQIYNNTIYNHTHSSQFEIEAYCCNSTWNHNKVYGGTMSAFSIGAANASKGKCQLAYNEVYNTDYIYQNYTVTYDTYAIKVYSPGSVLNDNWNISHNTFVAKGRGWYEIDDGDDVYNFTVMDNIFVTRDTTSALIRGTGEDIMGTYWNYNAYESGGSGTFSNYWNNHTDTTTWNTLAAALAGSQSYGVFDDNSIEGDPQFIDATNYDLRPTTGNAVCTASSTGSYIGALACATGEAVENIYSSINTIIKVLEEDEQ